MIVTCTTPDGAHWQANATFEGKDEQGRLTIKLNDVKRDGAAVNETLEAGCGLIAAAIDKLNSH